MKWTTKKPTVPGWYWVKCVKPYNPTCKTAVLMCELAAPIIACVGFDLENNGKVVMFPGDPVAYILDLFSEWSGPLMPPEDLPESA